MISFLFIIGFSAYFLAVGFRTAMSLNLRYIKILNKLLDFKPFTCVMCLSMWFCIFLTAFLCFKGSIPLSQFCLLAMSSAGFAISVSKLTGF